MLDYVISVWYGKERLWLTFWVYYIVIPTPVMSILGMAVETGALHFALFFVLSWSVVILTSVAVWRCSNNYDGRKLWRNLVKVTVAIQIAISVILPAINFYQFQDKQ